MAKVINCLCGWVARGATADEAAELLEEHIRSDHPDIIGRYSRQDLIAMAEEA